MIELKTPISREAVLALRVGDIVSISGRIFAGRDAVLPKIVALAENGELAKMGIDLTGGVIFHTAVSPAGVGPTSSNKLEIESSMEPLSRAGIKLHLGKGAISPQTVEALKRYDAVYAVIPPVTALLEEKTLERDMLAFPELGMEALHALTVHDYQAVIAAANGESLY